MKTSTLIFTFTILLSGCQATPPAKPAPVVGSTPVPPAFLPLPTRARAPEVVKTYTIGAYVDPDDPTLRHEAHTVQRIEAAAYWDLRPVPEAHAPAPVPSHEEAGSPAIQPPSPVPPVTVAAQPVPVELTIDPEPALMPNADGEIDLTSVDVPASDEANPFTVRAIPASQPRSIELRVTGILAGAKPCAIINGQLLEPGATVEGLAVKRIEPSAVILTLGRHRLRVPISAEPVRVRTTP